MRISWERPRLSPDEFYELLRRHVLLPMHLGEDKLLRMVRATADAARFGMVLEDGDDPGVLATTLTYLSEPGVLMFWWIPEVKRLHTRRDELIDLGSELRSVWFRDGVRRVEARVPIQRTQTIRALKNMGFRQETLDWGLRGAVDYGKGPEGLAILGLLEADPPRERRAIAPELTEAATNG